MVWFVRSQLRDERARAHCSWPYFRGRAAGGRELVLASTIERHRSAIFVRLPNEGAEPMTALCEPAPALELVGRNNETARITALIDSVVDAGGALVMTGDPGIGKSALLEAAKQYAVNSGFTLLEATGFASERLLPYAGLDQLLRVVIETAGVLPRVQRDALATALGIADGPAPEPFLVGLAALNLITNLTAHNPVLVAVDDVHRLDSATQEVLAFVAHRAARAAIAVIGTARRDFDGPFRAAGIAELEVGPLAASAARDLLTRATDELGAAARDEIVREALGNPLALIELSVARRAGGDARQLTARLQTALAGPVAELPSATRDAVLVAAASEGDDLAEIIAAASELSDRSLSPAVLDAAMRAGILDFDEMRVRFRHPLVRGAVLQAESQVRRRAAHEALARVLQHDSCRRAWHRAHAIVGPDDAVADELEANHVSAVRRGSPLTAIWALERSAQLSTDPSSRVRRPLLAAEYAFDLGRADMVERMLGLASAARLSTLDQARAEWLREIFHDGVPGDASRILELCAVAQQSVLAGDTDLALNLILAASLRCWWADPGGAARAAVVKAARELPNMADDPRVIAATAVADWNAEGADVIKRLDAVALQKIDDPVALRLLGAAAHAVGHPIHAVDCLVRAEGTLREQGRAGLLVHVLNMQIMNLLEVGDWDAASARIDEARRLAYETGQPAWEAVSLSLAAMLAGARGDNDEAQELARQAEKIARRHRLNSVLACVQLARGFGWIGAGRHEEAYDALRRMFDESDPAFHSAERNRAIALLAEAAVRIDRDEDARSLLARLERDTESIPSPVLHVQLAYARALLSCDDDAEALYLDALSHDLTRWPWARARLELAYGTWLRRQRRVSESRRFLRSARNTLEVVGARVWAEHARAELRAAGERDAADLAAPVHEALSAQEMEIVRLAAAGLSNREIGNRLFLSHRTVGSHLYRVFPKLNVTSRAQLAAALESI
jgi:DNA-binding CsgD family transcriptional regulator/tetratricopeptide (TPR) repeat protein